MKAEDYKVIIPDETFQKVMYFVNKTNFEVSGFAHVDYDPVKKTFTVGEPFLCKQVNHSTETEMDALSINKAQYNMYLRSKELGKPQELRWWWHSHVNMQVFWSGTDMTTIKQLGSNGWILATVFNKRAEMKSAILTVGEVMGERSEIFLDNLPTTIERLLKKDVTDAWDAEHAANVEEKKWEPTPRPAWSVSGKGEGQTDFEFDAFDNDDYDRTWRRDHPSKNEKGNVKLLPEPKGNALKKITSQIFIQNVGYEIQELEEFARFYNMSMTEYVEWIQYYGATVDSEIELYQERYIQLEELGMDEDEIYEAFNIGPGSTLNELSVDEFEQIIEMKKKLLSKEEETETAHTEGLIQ